MKKLLVTLIVFASMIGTVTIEYLLGLTLVESISVVTFSICGALLADKFFK